MPPDIVIVSDLHLGAYEDEFFALAFERFLDHLGESDVELLLLGDALDFVEARPRAVGRRAPVDTSEAGAASTLDWIARHHPPFFRALGHFVGRGHRVHVLPGNHDLELMRSSTRAQFCSHVEAVAPQRDAAMSVRFHPWIFYVPGLLYAEHGHQHHDINVVDTLLRPEDPERPGELALPLASYLVEGWPRFAVRAARRATHLRSRALARRRAAYHRDALTPEAAAVPLPAPALVALDRLSDTGPAAIVRRLASQAVRRAPDGPTQRQGYLRRAAGEIDRVLREAGAAVPYITFGHTHLAERLGVRLGAEYLNCGTWSPFVPRGLDRAGRRLTFVRISHAEGASIGRWDDATAREVPLAGG